MTDISSISSPGQDAQHLLNNVLMRLGQLDGTVKTFMDAWARQDQLANDGRRQIHERLDLLGRQVERVATDMQNVVQDVAELKKELDEEIHPVIKSSGRLISDITVVQQGLANIKKELDEEVGPAVELFENSRQRKIGARGVWALIGGFLIAVASGVAFVADKALNYVLPKGP